MKNRFKVTILALLMTFSAHAFATPSATACSTPSTDNLIHSFATQAALKKEYLGDPDYIIENATSIKFATQRPLVQWLALSWDGPPDGLLFAIACEGTTIGVARVGSVEEIKPGPTLPVTGDTVLVSATDGTGTGGIHKMISLFAIKDGHLITLWHHTLYESDYHQEGEDGEETDFLVTLQDNNKLDVFGQDRFFHPEGEEWSETPYKTVKSDEVYCWNSARSAYEDCTPKATQR